MDKDLYLNKLTSSAKEALEETSNEIIDHIIEKAIANAQKRNTAEKEIGLRDIIEAKEELWSRKILMNRLLYKRKRLTWLISMTGVTYALIGIIFYLYQNKSFDIKNDLGLIIAAIGIMVTLFAFIYSQLSVSKYSPIKSNFDSRLDLTKSDIFSEYEIVKRWQLIEKLGTDLMKKSGYTENSANSINEIIKFLSNTIRDELSSNDLRQILLARNRVVHNSDSLTKSEKNNIIKKSNELIELLEKEIEKY